MSWSEWFCSHDCGGAVDSETACGEFHGACVHQEPRPRWELRLSRKLWTRSQACPGGAVSARTAVGPAGTAQILKAILGSAMRSQTSDIWEVLPWIGPPRLHCQAAQREITE